MSSTINCASKIIHPWSKDSLLLKAQRYAQEMLTYSRDDWQFGLTSTFVLEFVARAALANINPALLADLKTWDNLYYALGHTPTTPTFIPKSINISEVFSRLAAILPKFTNELKGFSVQHLNRRNEELHAGSTPFDGLTATWNSNFYQALTILLESMGENLELLVGKAEAHTAQQLISASLDKSSRDVAKSISAHKTVWDLKNAKDKELLTNQASVWATRQMGHRVKCPSCNNDSLVEGNAISEPTHKLEDGLIIVAQEYLPSRFECIACQLKITGLSQLSACGLGSPYKSTLTYDAAEYYAPEDNFSGFEDDNNEP